MIPGPVTGPLGPTCQKTYYGRCRKGSLNFLPPQLDLHVVFIGWIAKEPVFVITGFGVPESDAEVP